MITSIIIIIVTGIATVYGGPFIGEPLFCGGVYDVDSPAWVALPVSEYGVTWECGDVIYLSGDDWSLMALAMDAGPLSRYYVEDYPELSIVADIPEHLVEFKLSSRATMINVSKVVREVRQ